LESEGIAPRILDLGTRWRWVVSFTPRPLYSQGKSPWYPLGRKLGGPHRWSGRSGEKKNFQVGIFTSGNYAQRRTSIFYNFNLLFQLASPHTDARAHTHLKESKHQDIPSINFYKSLSLSRKAAPFMVPKRSLLCSQISSLSPILN